MSPLLDEQYFTWLYSEVGYVKSSAPTRTYWSLLRHLYKKEFVWLIANDDNRVEDGRDLRHEFIEVTGIEVDYHWMELGCSVLEMMVALSRRLSFLADGEPREWFWEMIQNLQLIGYNDQNYKGYAKGMVDDILEPFIWRNYNPDGTGGLFPLTEPEEDQRSVEIWFQLQSYLLERGY